MTHGTGLPSRLFQLRVMLTCRLTTGSAAVVLNMVWTELLGVGCCRSASRCCCDALVCFPQLVDVPLCLHFARKAKEVFAKNRKAAGPEQLFSSQEQQQQQQPPQKEGRAPSSS